MTQGEGRPFCEERKVLVSEIFDNLLRYIQNEEKRKILRKAGTQMDISGIILSH